MKFDLCHPEAEHNDRFILSKGHGVPVLYSVYKQLGVISDDELMQLRKFESPLEGHPTPRFIYNEAATGSLGQGLAIGAGMAINAQQEKSSYTTYVFLGDGELAEGSIWGASEIAVHYKLSNLIGIVDCNRLGQTGQTLYGHDVTQYAKKFEAFGWNTITIDGHNVEQIIEAIDNGKNEKDKPTMIIAKTYKGFGVDKLEDKNGFHGKPVPEDELDSVLKNLQKRFSRDYDNLQKKISTPEPECKLKDLSKEKLAEIVKIDIKTDKHKELFEMGKKLPTRKAFGYALAALGHRSKRIIVLDGDVKNSTFTQFFEDEHPERMIQCFIAEQTMIGVATGLEARGKIPFAATFGAFLTRAHDQIRMAGVGKNALRLCGSHCGVSIGEDGPSQMGLEDISMMRAIPDSVVLYPSDAVSTYKLVGQMADYNKGISYMRTTRSATPVLYNFDEEFSIGGCKVIKQSENDQACIIAAGITLFEALKAYEILKSKEIFVSIIDAYSVKPLDIDTIRSVAKKSGNKIITIEDHFIEGGLGEAVASALSGDKFSIKMLAVTKISRSAPSDELLADAGINAEAIVSCF
jgi:transketolase